MYIKAITSESPLWQGTIRYAASCSWKAGPYLAKAMQENRFADWERVFVAVNNEEITGYCTFVKKDCIPDVDYYPFIGFVFVDEVYRGARLSQRLINAVIEYARELSFNNIYITSGEKGLYEKYGFSKIDEKVDSFGNWEQVFIKKI